MVRESRIADWGLSPNVEFLVEGGMMDAKAIADKLNEDPAVRTLIRASRVLPIDVENYLKGRNVAVQKAVVARVVDSPDGKALVEQARDALGWIFGQVELLKVLAPKIQEDFETQRQRWMAWSGPSAPGEDPPAYAAQQLDAMLKVIRLIHDVSKDAQTNDKVRQFLSANVVNVNQGIPHADMFDILQRMAAKVECPHCGFHSFGFEHMSAAYARAQSERKAQAPVDAAVAPTG